MERDPDPTVGDVDLDAGDDVDEGDVTPDQATTEIPDTPDETEGEAWEAEKDVTPDASADDAVDETEAEHDALEEKVRRDGGRNGGR
jgi:hypothetical protein